MTIFGKHIFGTVTALLFIIFTSAAWAETDEEYWGYLQEDIFGEDVELLDGSALLKISAPLRASDAALVPIGIRALRPQTPELFIETMYLIIDRNPSPLAAVIQFAPETGRANLATRVRVNEATDVHVVAKLNTGAHYVVKTRVNAAGGCSSPASKDPAVALARMGKMKFSVVYGPAGSDKMQGKLKISHPNFSGMQPDGLGDFIPAQFIRDIRIKYAGKQLLSVQTDFSLSEDPSIHFNFLRHGEGQLTVEAVDSDEFVFNRSWDVRSN